MEEVKKIIMKNFIKELIDKNYKDSILPKDRLKVVFAFVISLFLVLSLRLFYVSLFLGRKNSNSYILSEFTELGKRNQIVDRNGVIVASDIDLVSFYLNRELLINPERTSEIIHSIIPEVNAEKLYEKLINANNRAKFILVKKNITPKQQASIKESGILGFEFNNSVGRIYPHKNLFSHVVGYVDIDRKGIAGLESQYNDYLTNIENPPLKLTLDIRIQSIVRQQLLKAMEKYKAKSAIGIVSEVKTGNILAIVNLPDFDPNQPASGNEDILYNKATYGVYEMGSVFKVFTLSLALDKGITSQEKRYDISQVITYGNYEIKQDNYTKKLLTPEEILAKSSNVGTGLIAIGIGNERMKEFMNLIGMFDRVPANFPSLAKPLVPKVWRDINTITISYGHGLAVTPLHVIMGIGGIVNNGNMKVPRFVTLDSFDDTKIISEKTSKIMNGFLRGAVKNGTGWRANSLGYSVGGKTGSAQLIKSGKYQQENIMANFVGVFPMNDPHFMIYVMVEGPKLPGINDNISGGTIAAPVFARIIENIAPILNVVPYIDRIK